jgi:hypothetical protein
MNAAESFIVSAQLRIIMKIILMLTIGLVLVILVAGCTSGTPSLHPNLTSTGTIGTTAIPTPSETPQTVTTSCQETISPAIPQKTLYSTSDVNNHFVEIAFGPDYSSINKWNKELVHVAITGNYDSNDIKTLNEFSSLFNSYSSTTKLPAEVHQGEALGDIVVNFLPESSLNNINTDTSWKILKNPETGTTILIYKTNPFQYGANTHTIYINSDLKGDERTHWILRSVLYELGFPGETGMYPDSIFYSDSDTTTHLNTVDLRALELMYGTKISSGMSLRQIRQVLFIDI